VTSTLLQTRQFTVEPRTTVLELKLKIEAAIQKGRHEWWSEDGLRHTACEGCTWLVVASAKADPKADLSAVRIGDPGLLGRARPQLHPRTRARALVHPLAHPHPRPHPHPNSDPHPAPSPPPEPLDPCSDPGDELCSDRNIEAIDRKKGVLVLRRVETGRVLKVRCGRMDPYTALARPGPRQQPSARNPTEHALPLARW